MGPQFSYEGLQNLGPFSFKFHHNMIGPLYAILSFFVFDVVMRISKRRKGKIKMCNTHI
jgi:hypothetical protein